MMTPEKTISVTRDDIERAIAALEAARARLKAADILSERVSNAAQDMRRAAGGLMAGAVELQQAQRIAAAAERTALIVG